MRHLPLLMCTAFCGLYSTQTKAADTKNEKPNILWLTFEDTSAYEFGCYGNRGVHTPNADSLAARGIQFMNAWSVAPQSSAARSSLIPDAIQALTAWTSILCPTIHLLTSSFHRNYAKPDITVQTTARHTTTLPLTIKYVGTNVATKPHTIVPNEKRTNPFSLYSTR